MKSTITKLKQALFFGVVAMGFFSSNQANAQLCSATHSYGCGGLYGYCGDIDVVTVKNAKGGVLATYSGLKCASSSTYMGILNTGAGFDLTAGQTIIIELTGTSWAGYSTKVGAWIDANKDNNLSSAECLIDPNMNAISSLTSFTVKLPCFSSTGKSYLRFRGTWNIYSPTKSSGCGSFAGYGNDFDLEVNLKVGSSPVAGFIIPTGPNWQGTDVTFTATNPNDGADYTWTYQSPNKVTAATGTKGIARWNTQGKYDVKMLVNYCGQADSITKQVTIDAPTKVPTADFIAQSNSIELGFNGQLFDLSTNGPTSWAWELKSPTGAGDATSTAQNPVFSFVETGWHNVCLTSTNAVGASTKLCKNRYIECTQTLDNYLGPQHSSTTKIGRLFDHAGPTANYANGRKTSFDYFQILPCGATKIKIKYTDLDFADNNDKLRIYDSDKVDPNKEVTPKGGATFSNMSTLIGTTITLTSGAAYITFESDANGTGRGFILNWECDLATPTMPKASWSTAYSPVGVGAMVDFKNTTSNTKGLPTYNWIWGASPIKVNGVSGMSTTTDYSNSWSTDGTYDVCVIAQTCTGIDTFCKQIVIDVPSAARVLDYSADNVRPTVNSLVSITTKTDYADNFLWSIYPTSFTWENGTSASSKNPQIKFTKGGPYTFTLTAWNGTATRAVTEKKVIKNKYVIVLDPCIPLVGMTSSDVIINNVNITDSKGSTLLDNASVSDGSSYTDYTTNASVPVINMTFGASYNLTVSRKSNSNAVNYNAWIDWNIDGNFDANEQVMTSGTISGMSTSATITVPAIANSFEGTTRLRVGVSYGSFSNTACGVNQVGEFEDYAIKLANDNMPPVIQLVGTDTVRVERTATAGACYAEVASKTYKGIDGTEGDLTSKIVMSSDLDCKTAGVYTIQFDLTDASGNKAQTRYRTVVVVLDKTGPKLTLQGKDTINIEQCGTYNEAGATAIDNVDGDLTSAIKINGKVDPSTVGDYKLVYTVKDAQSNYSSITRVVRVRDTKKPGIYHLASRITNGMTINVQINEAFVDDIYALDTCNGTVTNFVKKPGYFGMVNNQIRNTYPITYYAADPSGNKAVEDGYVINYRVDDYVAPNIELNTSDTIYIDVNNTYSSRSVTVTDNFYPVSKISVVKTGTVDPYTLGTYVETFSATDESGNTATKRRYVKVVDRIAPTITAPPVSACVGSPFWAMTGLILQDNYYAASDLKPLVKVLSHNVNILEAGVYYINYSLTDPSGNVATIVSRTVYVQYAPNCQNTYMGTEQVSLDKAVNVYPNPTSGKVNIGYTLTNNQPLTIEVTNMSGAVVEKKVVNGGFGTAELNLFDLAPGVYQVRMTNNGESTVKKLVKD